MGKYAIRELEGRPHYVIPTVMMTVGVRHGNGGPVLYTNEALGQFPARWNGKPVVAAHPDIWVSGGLAGNPQIFSKQKIGTVFNARYVKPRLMAEAWIDVERVESVDPVLADNIERGIPTEVSIGVFSTNEETPGTFDGREYDAVAHNLNPDHLAILTHQIGACSLKDGCGILRDDGKPILNGEEPEPLPVPVMIF